MEFPDLVPGVPLPPACKDLLDRMLDKEPMTRITMKHIMLHPFVSSLVAKFEAVPDNEIVPKKKKPAVPLYLSHALSKILSKDVVSLTVTKKKAKNIEV